MQPLPFHPSADYDIVSVRVTCHSTVTVRCVLYTVPSRLIGQRLSVHLYHDRLVGFLGRDIVLELARVYPKKGGDKRRARSVNYRHVIESLRRKPRAFLGYQWREDLLPNESYRRIWREIQVQFSSNEGCRLMVESLYLAAVCDKEYLVGLWMENQLRNKTPSLKALQQQFTSVPTASLAVNTVEQHSLAPYDQLLHHEFQRYCPACFNDASTSPALTLHETPMVGIGKSSHS